MRINSILAPVKHLCTISTASHLYKALALADSLEQGSDFTLHILVVDGNGSADNKRCRFWGLEDIKRTQPAAGIVSKYFAHKDKLRWSLKPVFMNFLMNDSGLGIDKVLYLDNDLFFYNDYSFLFELLNQHSFLLTPHHYRHDPNNHQNWFEANYRVGLYNAGFVGAAKSGTDGLKWWAECCLYRCEKNIFRGLFDDQKYLDLLPVMDGNTHIVRHKGCNVAGWNIDVCKRESRNGEVVIDGQYPVVFIHFNDTTIREIIHGNDEHLAPHYHSYVNCLKKYKPNLTEKELLFTQPFTDRLKYNMWKIITEFGI